METRNLPAIRALRPAWNTGRIVGQKPPPKLKHVWAIRVRLELAENHRDLALFNMAIDNKRRGCDHCNNEGRGRDGIGSDQGTGVRLAEQNAKTSTL